MELPVVKLFGCNLITALLGLFVLGEYRRSGKAVPESRPCSRADKAVYKLFRGISYGAVALIYYERDAELMAAPAHSIPFLFREAEMPPGRDVLSV